MEDSEVISEILEDTLNKLEILNSENNVEVKGKAAYDPNKQGYIHDDRLCSDLSKIHSVVWTEVQNEKERKSGKVNKDGNYKDERWEVETFERRRIEDFNRLKTDTYVVEECEEHDSLGGAGCACHPDTSTTNIVNAKDTVGQSATRDETYFDVGAERLNKSVLSEKGTSKSSNYEKACDLAALEGIKEPSTTHQIPPEVRSLVDICRSKLAEYVANESPPSHTSQKNYCFIRGIILESLSKIFGNELGCEQGMSDSNKMSALFQTGEYVEGSPCTFSGKFTEQKDDKSFMGDSKEIQVVPVHELLLPDRSRDSPTSGEKPVISDLRNRKTGVLLNPTPKHCCLIAQKDMINKFEPIIHESISPATNMTKPRVAGLGVVYPTVHFASPLADYQTYSPLSSMSHSSESTVDAWEGVDMEGTESLYDDLEFMSRSGTPLGQWVCDDNKEQVKAPEIAKGISSELKGCMDSHMSVFQKVKSVSDNDHMNEKSIHKADFAAQDDVNLTVGIETSVDISDDTDDHTVNQIKKQNIQHVSVILKDVISAAIKTSVPLYCESNKSQNEEECCISSKHETIEGVHKEDSSTKAKDLHHETDKITATPKTGKTSCDTENQKEQRPESKTSKQKESDLKDCNVLLTKKLDEPSKVQQQVDYCSFQMMAVPSDGVSDNGSATNISQMQQSASNHIKNVTANTRISCETSTCLMEEPAKCSALLQSSPEDEQRPSTLDNCKCDEHRLSTFSDHSLEQIVTPNKDQRVPSCSSTPGNLLPATPEMSIYDDHELGPPVKKAKYLAEYDRARSPHHAIVPPSKKCLFQAKDGGFTWSDWHYQDTDGNLSENKLLSKDADTSLPSIVQLTACKKPIRLGLSKKRKVPSLHPHVKKH